MGETRARDIGRQAAYDAERFAFSGSWLDSPLSFDEAVALATRIVSAGVWRRLGGRAIEFTIAIGEHSWCRGSGLVAFTNSVSVSTVTHELAHALTHDRHPDATGHGPEWRGLSVLLVEIAFGAEAAAELAHAWSVYGLDVTRPAFEWMGAPLIEWS